MSPWAEVLGRIQARDTDGTARLVTNSMRPHAARSRRNSPATCNKCDAGAGRQSRAKLILSDGGVAACRSRIDHQVV